ncbi:TolC family protein [Pelomonas sp. KK5]|uniref:TolC family protein n=1 Tax=Pelomonas sp. KK5 TaxID=1855730 RepID=UPI001E590FD5|nr:TolC family protein [Pelomonas sp. KK5]
MPLTPITADENRARAEDLLARHTAGQEPVARPIDLYEAMARAIKYNLDYRVEVMTHALRSSELEMKRYEMLPRAVAGLNWSSRSNDSGGSSRSLLTGKQSLESSTSSERSVLDVDLNLSWDVLDFGLSYVRARQAGNEVLIAEEHKRKALVRIIEDVRTAYWRAVSAQRMLGRVMMLQLATEDALRLARQQADGATTAPLAPLSYQREILSIRRDAQGLMRDLVTAKQQLAALMNLPPETEYELVLPERDIERAPLTMGAADMLKLAIANRPELREVAYQLRNNDWETTASKLRALPSLKLVLGVNWNSNDYLYNQAWLNAGAQASWSLMNVFRLPADLRRVDAQGALLDQRALALTTAVGVQVYVARARYEMRREELQTAGDIYRVQRAIMAQIDAGYEVGKLSRQTLIREQLNNVVSEIRYDVALADLQNAFANLYSSMGVDIVDGQVSSNDSVDALAARLRGVWRENEMVLTTKAAQ